MPPKKGDPKSAAKKGKSEEPKKGGKDDKKGGKDDKKGGKKVEEPPAKGKGKDDGKKGKGKKPVSESEEGSEEEEEEMKTEEEESGDSEEEVVTKKPDKGKGKAALKGASKAMAVKGFKPPSKQPPPSDDESDDGKPQIKKGMGAVNLKKMSDVHIKGASKAMMGFAAEGQKKTLGAAKVQKTPDVKSHLKGASKAITGLTGKASPFSFPSKQQQPEKAKPKRNLKSTSRLFLRLSKKKKPAAGSKPLLGTSKLFAGFGAKSADKKPGLSGFSLLNKKDNNAKETTPPKKTINLSSLGGKGNMATEAKGLGGKFKGMFGKKKTTPGFKAKSSMLGRIAAATNWLTGRFLTSKGHGQFGARAGGRGRKRLSFANRDTRGRQTHYYNGEYEYDDNEHGYEDDYHDRWRPRGFGRQPIAYDPYDPFGEEMDYYDDDEWEDEYGYYDEEGNFYYDDELYYDDEMDYYDYPYGYYEDEYDDYYGDEGVEYYYGEDGMLYAIESEPYGYYGDAINGFSDPYDPWPYEEYFDHNVGSAFGLSDSYGLMNGGNGFVSGLYNDPMLGYPQPAPTYNHYQQPFHMDSGLIPVEIGQLYGQEQLSYPLPEPVPTQQFRFPRPQVRLFGKDRLEVETLPPPPLHSRPPSPMVPPPSPVLALNNQEMMSDIQYEQPIHTYHPTQPNYPTVMNQQHTSILAGHAPFLTAASIQQEHIPFPQHTYPPFPVSPSHLTPSPLPPQFSSQVYQDPLAQDPQTFQMVQMTPLGPPVQPMMHSQLHSPVASPRPVRRMSPLPSPQLSLRLGSTRAMAPPSSRLSPHHMDFQTGIRSDLHLSPHPHRRVLSQRAPVPGQRPTSPVNRRRPHSPPPSSPLQHRRGMSVRTQPSMTKERGDIRLRRAPSSVRPQSPISSPLASPRGSLRKRASPPPSPRLSFRQQPPPDAVHLPSTRPQLFRGRKQTSKMRRSPSPPQPHSQRRSPTQPERAESPPRSFRPTSPHRPPSPSPSRITSRPLPTRSSTRRMRGGAGIRSHVPMGAVKPSPANPYLQRHSRHGAPVTQHVAPFRSSIHSGPAPLSGQIEDIAGTPMLARAGSRPTGLRESKRIGTPQRGFHRPVGRGQPLVRMPRNQSSLQSRQSFRAPPPGPPAPPQQSLKQSGPLSSQPSVRRLQSTPPSPQPLQQQSPMLSRSASPMHHLSHPPSPLPHRAMSPHGFRPASFQPPVPNANISLATFPPSQNITHYDYTLMEPGPSPMLTNALPNGQIVGSPFPTSPLPYSTIAHTSPLQRPSSPQTQHEIYPQSLPQLTPSSPNLGRTLQNPYLHNVSNTTAFQRSPLPVMPGGQEEISANVQESQMMPQYPTAGLSNALMQNSRLRSASYSFPLQRNANLYTTVLTPPEAAVPLAPSVPSSPQLSPAMLTSQLRNASFASPFQRQPSPTLPGSPAPPPSPQQQGGVRGSSPLLSGGLRTSHIQGSMFKLPGGTLTMSRGPVETPVNTDSVGGVSSGMLSNALQNQSLHRATYRLPDGSFVTRNEPAEHVSGPSPLSSPMLSSALLNPNLRQATYRLPDGTLVTRTESTPAPSLSSSTLSSALLNANVRNASYRLPDSSFLTRPGEQTQSAESSVASPGLSSALMNANLRKAKFQLPEGSSLFSRNQAQPSSSASSGPVLSGALLKTNIRGASYRLPNTSLFKQPGSTDASQPRSLDLSNALRNQNLRSATYRLPDGTLMTRPQPASTPKALDLSNALSKNPNLRGAKYRLPDGNIMTRLGVPKAPEPRTLNLSGALQNPHLRGASFRLPSSYAVVSPQVQGSGPRQHWAQNAGVEAQQDEDVWGAERVLPHGTVQNLNKWSMYGEGELLDPRSLMGQEGLGNEQGEWNLRREGEPHGQWFDKVISKNECGMTKLCIHNG